MNVSHLILAHWINSETVKHNKALRRHLWMKWDTVHCVTEECVLFTWNNKVNSYGFSSFMYVIMTWESVLSVITNSKVWLSREATVAYFSCMKAHDLCHGHFTMNTIHDRCSLQHFLPSLGLRTLSFTLIDPHRLSPRRSNKQSCWTRARQSQLGLNWARSTLILDFSLLLLPSPHSPRGLGSHHGRVAGLACGNLQPGVTICYVANAWCSGSFTFLSGLLCIVNALLAFMKVFTCNSEPRCRYLYRGLHTAKVMAFSQVMKAIVKGAIHQITGIKDGIKVAAALMPQQNLTLVKVTLKNEAYTSTRIIFSCCTNWYQLHSYFPTPPVYPSWCTQIDSFQHERETIWSSVYTVIRS